MPEPRRWCIAARGPILHPRSRPGMLSHWFGETLLHPALNPEAGAPGGASECSSLFAGRRGGRRAFPRAAVGREWQRPALPLGRSKLAPEPRRAPSGHSRTRTEITAMAATPHALSCEFQIPHSLAEQRKASPCRAHLSLAGLWEGLCPPWSPRGTWRAVGPLPGLHLPLRDRPRVRGLGQVVNSVQSLASLWIKFSCSSCFVRWPWGLKSGRLCWRLQGVGARPG